jgi:hypothetical protein
VIEKRDLKEVTDYGFDTVDRISSISGGRFAQLGLSPIWLCTLGRLRRGAVDSCLYAADRTALKGGKHTRKVKAIPGIGFILRLLEIFPVSLT